MISHDTKKMLYLTLRFVDLFWGVFVFLRQNFCVTVLTKI